MKKDFLAIVALFALSVGCSVFFYQCKKSSTAPANPPGSPPANEVWIQNMAFNPASITVSINTTINWTNKDATAHTVTSTTGLFDSGSMGGGTTYSHLFNAAGSYPYKCTFHPGMTGTVTVQP